MLSYIFSNSLEYHIKETMHRAFWDILRSSLNSDPPDYQPALRLLEEIRHSLEGLVLPNQTTLRKLIGEFLDIDVAKSQLEETGHLSLETYKDEVINLMKRFCAPIRDQEVEELRKIIDPIDAFRQTFILLDKMHMDLANFTIEQMRPYIRQQAVTYERTKFATFLEAQQKIGIDGLGYTRDWIKQAHNDLLNLSLQSTEGSNSGNTPVDVKKTSDDSTNLPGTVKNDSIPLTPNNILREAYLKLLTWPRDRDWPETMLMDQNRLIDLGNQLTIIVHLTSLVLVVCNYMASNASSFTSPASSSPTASLTSTKAIFSVPLRTSLPPDAMVQLKKSICQDIASILQGICLNYKPDQLVDDIIEQVILTIELWYNRCMESGGCQSLISLDPSESASTTTTSMIEQKSSIAYFTDFGRTELTVQLSAVILGEHPVYKLMHKRAMDFLRSALSSYPPENLLLPPGFSILLDLDQDKLNAYSTSRNGGISSNSTGYLHQTPLNIPTTIVSGGGSVHLISQLSPSSPTNHRLRSESESSYRTQKIEILSLSGLASRLLPLLAHNRHVFGSYYAEIIQPLIMPIKQNTSTNNE
ncbi:unnamed protein product [Heterobilharzia americana]|nr:unnamed protein product [Heterobilharzia americana]